MEYFPAASVLISGLSLYFAYKAWTKSRAIYGIDLKYYYKYIKPSDINNPNLSNQAKINIATEKALSSGNFTILKVDEDENQVLCLTLGKLK